MFLGVLTFPCTGISPSCRTSFANVRLAIPPLTPIVGGTVRHGDPVNPCQDEESPMAPDFSSPDFFKEKADECLALSYQLTDPKTQVAVLKLANSWMRLAEYCHSRKLHQRTTPPDNHIQPSHLTPTLNLPIPQHLP